MGLYVGNTRYKVMIGNQKSDFIAEPLPYDAEIEYLEGDGNAYIDIGIEAGDGISVNATIYKDSWQSGKWAFGGGDSVSVKSFGVFYNRTSKDLRLWYNNNSYIAGLYANAPALIDIAIANGVCSIGGMSVNYTTTSFNSNYNIIIFGLQAGSNKYLTSVKIKNFYIKKGSVEIDLIPVRVGTVGYMYDRVSGQLFGNQGTGSFILGNDKNT